MTTEELRSMPVNTYTTLDDPLATNGTFAWGINASGQIVGSYGDASIFYHGFLYSGGSYTTLDGPLSSGAVAYGINDIGQVVGAYDRHGFLYSGASYTTPDDPSTGSAATVARCINAAGQIVGDCLDASINSHG